MNIVLMAGGGGTRLWPLSRKSIPKQFLQLDGKTTLLEATYRRATQLVAPDQIYVATLEEYGARVRELLPKVNPANIFFEPGRRDTAPAFAAVATQLVLKGKGAEPAVFMWSDHVFTAEADYLEDLKKIPEVLAQHPDAIVTTGHVPTFPETGFGYIEAGEPAAGYTDVYVVRQFKEKPDRATAEQYVAAGNYYWNIGSISVLPNYLLQELRVHQPALMAEMDNYKEALQSGDAAGAAAIYQELPKIAIDYALLEKAPRLFVITGDYGWSDVGNWAAVREVFGGSGDHVPAGHHLHVDSKDNFVYNTTKKAVSLIGVSNTIVVVTEDAVLVTDKNASHKVKDVVAKLEAEGGEQYL